MTKTNSIRVPADMEYLDKALAMICEGMEEVNAPDVLAMNVEVITEELFTNIASYAYDETNESNFAEITYVVDNDPPSITVFFKDAGKPYNPLEKEDPDVTLDPMDRPIGGLGIYMTKKLMDETHYEYKDNMNIFSFKKNF